jgi:hydroxymethylbilane synthase
VLLRALRPDLVIEPLRGNLDTRLKKLDDGHYQGIILAAAGLKRLGLSQRIRHIFDTQIMLPAAGQGAIGIEINSTSTDIAQILGAFNHLQTSLCVYAERAVSKTMGGSCSMPLAAHATFVNGTLQIHAAWGDHHQVSTSLIKSVDACELDIHDPLLLDKASALGVKVAQDLISQGAIPA